MPCNNYAPDPMAGGSDCRSCGWMQEDHGEKNMTNVKVVAEHRTTITTRVALSDEEVRRVLAAYLTEAAGVEISEHDIEPDAREVYDLGVNAEHVSSEVTAGEDST